MYLFISAQAERDRNFAPDGHLLRLVGLLVCSAQAIVLRSTNSPYNYSDALLYTAATV